MKQERAKILHDQVNLTLTNKPVADFRIQDKMEVISIRLKQVGHTMIQHCPDSRELSIALTKLQEARMFAIAAMAIHQDDIDFPGEDTRGLIKTGEGRRIDEEEKE